MEWELNDGNFSYREDIKKSWKNNPEELEKLFSDLISDIFGNMKPVQISKNQAIYGNAGNYFYIGIGNNVKNESLHLDKLHGTKVKIALPTSGEILQKAIKINCQEYIFASVVFDSKTDEPFFFFTTSKSFKDWDYFYDVQNNETQGIKLNATNRWFHIENIPKKSNISLIHDKKRDTYCSNKGQFINFVINLFEIKENDNDILFEKNDDDILLEKALEKIISSKMSEKEKITEILRIVKTRNGQDVFKKELLKIYEDKCMITGITQKQLLIASHIKPWSESNPVERLDPNNGIILSANMDKLFDNYLITFDEKGYMILSDNLKEETIQKLDLCNVKFKKNYNFNAKQQHYLEYHRIMFFAIQDKEY